MSQLKRSRIVFEKTFLTSFFLLFVFVQFGFLNASIGTVGDILLKPGRMLVELSPFTVGNTSIVQVASLFHVLFVSSFMYGVLFVLLELLFRFRKS